MEEHELLDEEIHIPDKLTENSKIMVLNKKGEYVNYYNMMLIEQINYLKTKIFKYIDGFEYVDMKFDNKIIYQENNSFNYCYDINLYLQRYLTYPNYYSTEYFYFETFMEYLKENYKDFKILAIQGHSYLPIILIELKPYLWMKISICDNGEIVNRCTDLICYARFLYTSKHVKDFANMREFISTIEFNNIEESNSVIKLLIQGQSGLDLISNKIKYIKDFDENINLIYGENFNIEYNNLLNLFKNNSHGLFLLHGCPGSGKTTLIRQIVNECNDNKKKVFIYIPNYLISQLTTPTFMSFLLETCRNYESLVLVIEDAEQLLIDREHSGDVASISNILNLVSGILNDIFKIQIIATFNTDLTNIDSALLRSGRLLYRKEFGVLSIYSAQKLCNKLGIDYVVTKEMSTADVFALKDRLSVISNTIDKKKEAFGFTID